MGMQDHLERREQQYKMQIDKSKRQIKQKVTELKDKQSTNRDSKGEIANLKSKLISTEKECQKFRSEIKSIEQKYELQINVVEDNFCRERAHYENSLGEMRSSIEDLMDVKNQLICENRKLQRILKKKQ